MLRESGSELVFLSVVRFLLSLLLESPVVLLREVFSKQNKNQADERRVITCDDVLGSKGAAELEGSNNLKSWTGSAE